MLMTVTKVIKLNNHTITLIEFNSAHVRCAQTTMIK